MSLLKQEFATIAGYLTLLVVLIFGSLMLPDRVGLAAATAVLLGLFLVPGITDPRNVL
jgi:hypothetical protein